MFVSIVMAMFFQRSGRNPVSLPATLSIEGLLPAWCQQASARTPKGATSTGHGWMKGQNEEAMRRTAGRTSPPAMQGAARQATFRPAARSLTASVVND